MSVFVLIYCLCKCRKENLCEEGTEDKASPHIATEKDVEMNSLEQIGNDHVNVAPEDVKVDFHGKDDPISVVSQKDQ